MAGKSGKRTRGARENIDRDVEYDISDAVKMVKESATAKFDETVEVAMNLNVDPRHADQMVRGTVDLPHGTGKKRRIIVFCQPGPAADAAKGAGAEVVGYDDLLKKVGGGWTDFDVAVATPEAMGEVRKLGRVLGPRGLMPNPKVGTVTDDTGKAVQEVKAGRVEYKLDKGANIQVLAAKTSFKPEQIVENAMTIIDAIIKAKPSATKGRYIENCVLSSTMSPGIPLDVREILKVA